MKLGIVGLPNVGKSTLFNAITNAGAEVANYAFCTIEPNVGVVAVPDYRLDELAKMYSPKKITPAVIEFVDIAGLVKGASKGEGLGNKFLSHIREVDAVIHVVRCFDNDDIMHVSGSVDPKRDIETINLELILSDLEILERRIDRTAKAAKGDKSLLTELEFLKRLKTELENGVSARAVEADDDEKAILADIGLLSAKPVIYACNMSEDDFASNIENNERYKAVCEIAKAEGAEVLPICAELEAEISSLSKEEKEMFLSDAGIESGGLDMLIQRSYNLLGLISYLTAGEPEVRAWTIKKGTKAPQAAGKIHSDFEKKGNVDFLKDVTPTSLSSDSKDSIIVTDTKDNTSSLKEELRTKKKSLDNWGRPRKQLIEGVKEVSLTVQLPETLIKALRKEGKKQGKSMKELIGTSLLSTYSSLLQ